MAKPHFKLKLNGKGVTFKPEDLSSHIAVSRQFLGGFNGWLPNPDPILRKAGRQISVYRELLRDPLVGSLVRRRKAAVARLDWQLTGDDVPENVRQFVENWLAETDVYRLIKDILNAPLFGYQPIELIWQQDTQWLPSEIVAKPQEWFGFDGQNELVYTQNGLKQEPLPPYKFLCPTHEADYLNPYGLGDLGLVFWLVTFKRGGLKFWVQFTEKYGAPWLIGKEPRSNTPDDTEKLLDALEALIANSVGTIPNDSSVEIHEASGKSSSVDAYDKLIRYCRSEINIALLGQDQTTDKDTNHASAAAGLEVAADIRDSDSRIVETTFNQLIAWVVELNFGDVPAPKFELFENEEAGTKERAERDKTLADSGLKFTPQYWKRTYGLEDGDIVEQAESPVMPSENERSEFPRSKKPSADFAEHNHTDAGLIIDTLAPDTGRLNAQSQALTAVLAAEIQKGETEDNILDRLAEAFPNMDDADLQNELARVIFLSDLVGRIEARGELV
ncbi:DUF935 domain-containing protein [Neisseria weixii]|uniref:DUF935 domain-containing protein n=1 Tax=Neisseria weixii TaxID=1853276 RepID=UPI000BB803FF|nr:DUF935 family protein [Neisseria weixii]ATD64847.1 hypothetical protein CGZ65_05145 [Neisseria weixii]